MVERIAAEIFPPGEFIREELEARGWTQNDLAEILGRSPRLVSEVISGKRAVTPETAQALADAFGTTAQFWMNLETAYRLHRLRKRDVDVPRRAKLYGFAPVKEMLRRHWIGASENLDVIERQVLGFFEVNSLDEAVPFAQYAGPKKNYAQMSNSECAWLFRAKKLAKAAPGGGQFTKTKFTALLHALKGLLHSAQ